MFFGGDEEFSLTILMLKVPPASDSKLGPINHNFMQTPVVVLFLFRTVALLLPSICTLLFISTLMTGFISKMKVASASADAILVAINKRINANY